MLLGTADLLPFWQVPGLGGMAVSSFALTMEGFHLCCWNTHSHWKVVCCFTEGFGAQSLVFSGMSVLLSMLACSAVWSCNSIWDHSVYVCAVCVFFTCGSASPSVCKPWAVLGKGRLWKAQLKQSRMSLLCQLGLQMHPLNVVLQSGWAAYNYSIRETTETIKRSWEQYFPLWPWPRSRLTKVILCEMWALLNLIVSLSSINLHYSKEKSSVSNSRRQYKGYHWSSTLPKSGFCFAASILLLCFFFCYSKD